MVTHLGYAFANKGPLPEDAVAAVVVEDAASEVHDFASAGAMFFASTYLTGFHGRAPFTMLPAPPEDERRP